MSDSALRIADRPALGHRMKKIYFVRALWDAEAEVWISESDVPGLVLEADTLAEFEQEMLVCVPELLAANVGRERSVSGPEIEFSASKRVHVKVA